MNLTKSHKRVCPVCGGESTIHISKWVWICGLLGFIGYMLLSSGGGRFSPFANLLFGEDHETSPRRGFLFLAFGDNTPPSWLLVPIGLMVAVGLLAMMYGEFPKQKYRFICKKCGKEELVAGPKRTFELIFVVGTLVCVVALILAMIITLAILT